MNGDPFGSQSPQSVVRTPGAQNVVPSNRRDTIRGDDRGLVTRLHDQCDTRRLSNMPSRRARSLADRECASSVLGTRCFAELRRPAPVDFLSPHNSSNGRGGDQKRKLLVSTQNVRHPDTSTGRTVAEDVSATRTGARVDAVIACGVAECDRHRTAPAPVRGRDSPTETVDPLASASRSAVSKSSSRHGFTR